MTSPPISPATRRVEEKVGERTMKAAKLGITEIISFIANTTTNKKARLKQDLVTDLARPPKGERKLSHVIMRAARCIIPRHSAKPTKKPSIIEPINHPVQEMKVMVVANQQRNSRSNPSLQTTGDGSWFLTEGFLVGFAL